MERITVEEAGQRFGMAPRTVFKYAKLAGLTRYRKPGDKRTWFDVGELEVALQIRPKPSPTTTTHGVVPEEERMQTDDGRNVMVAAIIPHPAGEPKLLVSVRVHGQEQVYSWIGGHVHKNETPEDAAVRELREELVIEAPRVIRTLARIDTHLDASPWWGRRFSRGYLSYNLLVDVESPNVEVIDHEELREVRWVDLDDLVEEWTKKLPPELRDPAIRSAREALGLSATDLSQK